MSIRRAGTVRLGTEATSRKESTMNRIENSNGTHEPKTINKLTQIQFFKLCEFVKANAEQFTKERPTGRSVAQQASTALGVAIGVGSIRHAKEATGVEWKTPKHFGNNGAARAERSKIRRKAFNTFASCLVELYTRVGEQVPAELVEAVKAVRELED